MYSSNFQDNWDWQGQFKKQVIHILQQNALHFIKIDEADFEQDTQKATDWVIKVEGGDIAVRIRDIPKGKYGDITIRAYNKGYPTELHKIKGGYARWYLYCWSFNGHITDWLLIDLDKVRETNLLDDQNVQMNKDGMTGFISIKIDDLGYENCIMANNKIVDYVNNFDI